MKPLKKITIYLGDSLEQISFLERLSREFSVNVDISNEQFPVVFIEDQLGLKSKKFSPRTNRMLMYLRSGLTYQEIADKEKISINGVRYYTKKLYKTLGVNNARSAVLKAI